MDTDKSPYNPVQEAVSLLKTMRGYIRDDVELTWTSYRSAEEARQDIDTCIAGIQRLDKAAIALAVSFFIPAGDFQNMALNNGWSDMFLIFAERYDKLYIELKEFSPKNLKSG